MKIKMSKIIRKTILTFLVVWSIFLLNWQNFGVCLPPSFNENFAEIIDNKDNKSDSQWRIEWMYKRKVNYQENIRDNIRALFYPTVDWNSQIWQIIRMLCFWFIFVYIVYIGIMMLRYSAEDKEKEYMMSLLYTIIWATVVLISTRIAQSIPIDTWWWSQWLVENLENKIFFQILIALKSMAFFVAIVMMLWYGYQSIQSVSGEDKLSIAKQWVLNIIMALVFIKWIDYVYFIAQNPDMKSKTTELIVEVIKILLYLIWAFFTFYILYSGFKLITDRWEWEWMTNFKKVATWIFLWSILIFIFLLILYQVISEFK